MRKPLTGHLFMRIHAVKDVDHAASSRFSRGPETFVVLKVEDAVKARTRATRSDRWSEEAFNIDIDKANEIELTVYDKAGDRPTPIGMLWIRISDIAEEMRRKKIETELNASGWVSADKMQHGGGSGRHDSQHSLNSPSAQMTGAPNPPAQGQGAGGAPPGASAPPVMIDSWFALEPVGRIHLTMSFGKISLCTIFIDRTDSFIQPSNLKTGVRLTLVSTGRVPSVRKRKRSTKSKATSSSRNSSTTSCAALCAETSSSTLPVCSVPDRKSVV